MKQNALLTQMMESFFAKPVEEKNLFHSTKEASGSGYLELVFDNRDSVRDKEIRQVFQVRMGAEGNIPWPSQELREAIYLHFRRQWTLSCR